MLLLILVIFAAGAFGGIVNAYMSDNGFILPKYETAGDTRIWRAGFLGNVIVGGFSAAASWGLYGPLAAGHIIGGPASSSTNAGIVAGITLSALVGAFLVGVGGSRWLSNEVDKKLLRAAAGEAASGSAQPRRARRLLTARPAEALRIAAGKDEEVPGS